MTSLESDPSPSKEAITSVPESPEVGGHAASVVMTYDTTSHPVLKPTGLTESSGMYCVTCYRLKADGVTFQPPRAENYTPLPPQKR